MCTGSCDTSGHGSGGTPHGTPNHRRINPQAPCYQVVSLNEVVAKRLCRRTPLIALSVTEYRLIRSYPAATRIESSNFNPLLYWAFGIQMAAINYQTIDLGSIINAALFEQNFNCGYVRKPDVMIDRNHVMFGRFNPWDKEFDGLYQLDLTIKVMTLYFYFYTPK